MSNPSSLPPKGRKPKVAFLCVHNACRSQIAQLLQEESSLMEIVKLIGADVLPDDIGTAWSGTSYQEANASKTGGRI